MKKILCICKLLFIYLSVTNAQTSINETDFLSPTQTSKIHTWWHWMGGNISKTGITKDLESMKAQGVVQATIFNIGEIYSQKVDVPKVKFNSTEWIEMYQWALKEANRLGITIGIQTIDGFATVGGSWISPELSMKQYVWTKTSINGGSKQSTKLPEPIRIQNYYQDEAVIAFPMKENLNSFKEAEPEMLINGLSAGNILFDGNPKSEKDFKKNHEVKISFNQEFTANKLTLLPHLPFSWDLPLVDNGKIKLLFELSISNDDKNYTKVSDLEFIGVNRALTAIFPTTKAKYFRFQLVKTSFVYFDVLPIAEFELLKDNELPLFMPAVTSFFEKTASVYDLNENVFDSNSKNTITPISEKSVIDITRFMSPDGTLNWDAPNGRWQIIRFGYTSTGVFVDPATPEGLGLEVDKMDTAALNIHINSYAKKLVDAAGSYKGNTLKFFLMDSWEAQFQTWSKSFAKEFNSRRGYNILPWIPVLCGETIESTVYSEAFLHDFRKTIAELLDQNFYKHFAELSHRNQMEFHGETIYGGWGAYPPMDALKSNEYIDMPMTEFWANANSNNLVEYQALDRPVTSMSTSSALAFNKQIIGSEAYTGNAHYSEAPADLKPYGDAAFCSGVNQIILHSYVHQPFDNKPGMTLGKFGGHYNRNNPVWEYTQDWLTYQSRVQYILQKGEPVVDVLFYVGDQLPFFYSKNFINNLPYGIRPNACNIDMLNQKVNVVDGKISIGGTQIFSLLMLHNSTKMELSTLKRIAELVKEGAVVYGPKPTEMLSLSNIKQDYTVFNKLVDEVWGNGNENIYGKGKMISNKPIKDVLLQLNVVPDLNTNTQDPKELMYIHKKLDGKDIYFVFNQQNKTLNREILFRVKNKTPEIWNPENGSVIKPAIYSMEKGQTRIPVFFKPYESKIFVFENEVPTEFIQEVLLDEKKIFPQNKLIDSSIRIPLAIIKKDKIDYSSSFKGNYTFRKNDKNLTKISFPETGMIDLNNLKTKIEFFPISNETIQAVEIPELKPYDAFDEPSIKYFSGKAKYTIHFSVPVNFMASSDSILLNLGTLGETAKVLLNGKLIAYPWHSNTDLLVTNLLKEENILEVTVANVARNRFIGDLIQFGKTKSLWTTSPIESILKKDMPLKASGLIGPLKLVAFKIK
jgi:hypothetical protein